MLSQFNEAPLESKCFVCIHIYKAEPRMLKTYWEKMKKIYSSYIRTYCEAELITTAWYQAQR